MTRADNRAVAELESGIRAWADRVGDVARDASGGAKRLVSDAESEVRERAQRVQALEIELAHAKGEARTRIARELQAASESLDGGRRALRQAKDVASRVETLRRRMSESTGTRVPRASTVLKHKVGALDRYASAKVPQGGSAAGSSGSKHGDDLSVAQKAGLTLVALLGGSAAGSPGSKHGDDLSVVQKAGLTLSAFLSLLPNPTTGVTGSQPDLGQSGDTAITRQANPQEMRSDASALYRVVEQQSDPMHQLSHAYEDQEMKDAEKRTSGFGESSPDG